MLTRGRSMLILLVLLPLAAGGSGPASAVAQAAGPEAVRPASWPPFLIGASYQGPAARSWREN
jgi:hypothetical protein